MAKQLTRLQLLPNGKKLTSFLHLLAKFNLTLDTHKKSVCEDRQWPEDGLMSA